MTPPRRYLALDLGERRTGLAATDESGTIAVPLPRLEHATMDEVPDLLEGLLEERRPEVLVVGLPLSRDGRPTAMSGRILEIVEALRRRWPDLDVRTEDEAMTTDLAHERLKRGGLKAARRKRLADSQAALAILQRHLGWI